MDAITVLKLKGRTVGFPLYHLPLTRGMDDKKLLETINRVIFVNDFDDWIETSNKRPWRYDAFQNKSKEAILPRSFGVDAVDELVPYKQGPIRNSRALSVNRCKALWCLSVVSHHQGHAVQPQSKWHCLTEF